MKTAGRTLLQQVAHPLRGLFLALVCILGVVTTSAGQDPVSRPILFTHGFCGDAFDFQTILGPLQSKLPPDLYPSNDIYYVGYDSAQDKVTFYTAVGTPPTLSPIDESAIPSNTRYFSIQFSPPNDGSSGPAAVANVSILNKGYELSRSIKRILAITGMKDVILVGHSQGGVDSRAYIENMASATACYKSNSTVPDYTDGCAPGAGDAAYAHDVGALITVDTPHRGSPLAQLNWGPAGDFPALACLGPDTVNKNELTPLPDGAGLIESLNYSGRSIAGKLPIKNTVPISAVEDYFGNVFVSWNGLVGFSDNAVKLVSQSITPNLSKNNSTAPLLDYPLPYGSQDPRVQGNLNCFLDPSARRFPLMHFMVCIGALKPTQDTVAARIIANAVPPPGLSRSTPSEPPASVNVPDEFVVIDSVLNQNLGATTDTSTPAITSPRTR